MNILNIISRKENLLKSLPRWEYVGGWINGVPDIDNKVPDWVGLILDKINKNERPHLSLDEKKNIVIYGKQHKYLVTAYGHDGRIMCVERCMRGKLQN